MVILAPGGNGMPDAATAIASQSGAPGRTMTAPSASKLWIDSALPAATAAS
jgi:hypothetical protein